MAIPDAGTSTIDVAFIEAFKSNVIHLCQQKPSRLRSTVDTMTVKAEIANVERIGAQESVEKTTRHTPTPILDVPHSRRRFPMQDWQWADLIDEEDEIRMLAKLYETDDVCGVVYISVLGFMVHRICALC